jgi:DNA-directed RNA polymerase alpha subunit
MQEIEATSLVQSDQQDILRWTPSTKGQCTTKEAYNHLASISQHHLPLQDSKSITQEALTPFYKRYGKVNQFLLS